jgi:hypothetical protein
MSINPNRAAMLFERRGRIAAFARAGLRNNS